MSDPTRAPSARREELLESAYRYALRSGLADLSLRPLATAVGSSPRVLLFLFGSKDGLIRELLARARREELALLDRVRSDVAGSDPATVVRATWHWLVAPAHRPLLTLWLEAYARSLVDPAGPWADFARQTVDDWLAVLAGPPARPHADSDLVGRTLALAVLRGALLDLLATGDVDRTTAAVELHLSLVDAGGGPR
ncbi:TetR/AcrR family transcriptional regulator [Micromonospora sp. URMC 103]|uniref:TetR/AcrR family transcriptional regulator n=1 Tax=Micromonospora sp. URMC 103 TaxID=3423406 RepID=UPI003F1C38E1